MLCASGLGRWLSRDYVSAVNERSETVARGPRFWLVLHPGQPQQQAAEVSADRVVIGRADDCDVVLDDPSVSRHHAEIASRPGSAPVLEDLGSANGTFVNGRRIRPGLGFKPTDEPSRAELQGGELLRIGDTFVYVSMVPPHLARLPGVPGTSG